MLYVICYMLYYIYIICYILYTIYYIIYYILYIIYYILYIICYMLYVICYMLYIIYYILYIIYYILYIICYMLYVICYILYYILYTIYYILYIIYYILYIMYYVLYIIAWYHCALMDVQTPWRTWYSKRNIILCPGTKCKKHEKTNISVTIKAALSLSNGIWSFSICTAFMWGSALPSSVPTWLGSIWDTKFGSPSIAHEIHEWSESKYYSTAQILAKWDDTTTES